jgi:S1-C subfamily serine protease
VDQTTDPTHQQERLEPAGQDAGEPPGSDASPATPDPPEAPDAGEDQAEVESNAEVEPEPEEDPAPAAQQPEQPAEPAREEDGRPRPDQPPAAEAGPAPTKATPAPSRVAPDGPPERQPAPPTVTARGTPDPPASEARDGGEPAPSAAPPPDPDPAPEPQPTPPPVLTSDRTPPAAFRPRRDGTPPPRPLDRPAPPEPARPPRRPGDGPLPPPVHLPPGVQGLRPATRRPVDGRPPRSLERPVDAQRPRTVRRPVDAPAGRPVRAPAPPATDEPLDVPANEGEGRRRIGLGVMVLAVAVVSGLIGGLVGVVATRELDPPGERAATETATTQAAVGQPETPQGAPAGDRLQQVLGAVLPAVVKVEARSDSGKATGSGVIFAKEGYVLTNAHVVDQARTIGVTLATSEPLRARLVGRDLNYDLAVLRVRRTGMKVARFGRSDELRVGDAAIVVGSPFGFQSSVTTGIVSALHRVVKVPDSDGDGRGRELVDAIQTDAAINPGNSGGALANASGQVVGISTAIATDGGADSSAGVGFAIPIDEALEVAKALVARTRIKLPFLGVEADRELGPDDVDRYRLGNRAGVLVSGVEPRSPAASVGLRRGDLIVRFGDQEVRARDQLTVAVRRAQVGVPVPVTVVRRGRQLAVRVVPTDQPNPNR